MYTASSQADRPMAFPPYERSHSYNDQTQSYAYSGPRMEPPRPFEPRPTLSSSRSESSSTPRRHEVLHPPPNNHSDYVNQSRNLPGLRDILSPGGRSSSSYRDSWSSAAGGAGSHHGSEGYHHSSALHPPTALHPANEPVQRYQPQPSRAFEVPVLETSPVSRYNPHSLPVSPYAAYPEAARDYTEARSDRQTHTSNGSYIASGMSGQLSQIDSYKQPAAGTYMNNSMPSPYTTIGTDDRIHRRRLSKSDRGVNASNTQGGTDAHGVYLGIEDVPGEGRFHVYEDGYRIPTQVDGEQVNPQWGLTKANKPRRRLALACLDCREKKIKCEPGKDRCQQCEKAMRPCRKADKFERTESITNTFYSADQPLRKPASASDPTPSTNRDIEPDPLNKRRSRADPSPPTAPNKKHRSASPLASAQGATSHAREGAPQAVAAPTTTSPKLPSRTRDAAMSWEEDPYHLNPDLTLHLLELYFAHINNATYCLFPRAHILNWVKEFPSKCQNERMVLYAMLATASIFAGHDLTHFGRQCADIAGKAVSTQIGKSNISVAQTKLLLSLYHFAKGADGLAWDYSGSAIRTVTHMRLNTEDGCIDDSVSMAQARFEFGFSRPQLAECKRRTFWSAFLQDRFGGADMCIIKPQDVFVRLPYTDKMYENSIPSDVPYFSNDIIDPTATILTPSSSLAPMSWLAIVAATWGDVVDFLFRAARQAPTSYRDAYETFYQDTWNRLNGWSSRLPDHLQFSTGNLERSINDGYAGTFVTMHALYHLSLMRINRCLRHALNAEAINRNIRTANSHGHQFLQMIVQLMLKLHEKDAVLPKDGLASSLTVLTPFLGYATLLAIDIISAGELENGLRKARDEVSTGVYFLHMLSLYWRSAGDQHRACEKRSLQLQNVATKPWKARDGCWLGNKWGMISSMEKGIKPEDDCIYGLGELDGSHREGQHVYYDAFVEDVNRATQGGLRIA